MRGCFPMAWVCAVIEPQTRTTDEVTSNRKKHNFTHFLVCFHSHPHIMEKLNKAKETIESSISSFTMSNQSHFLQNYRGPAQIAAEAAGVIKPAIQEPTNGSQFITSQYGNPWPADGAHALNVGGIPVTSDPFLREATNLRP